MLQVTDLSVSYGAISALSGISFKIDQGSIVTLIGGLVLGSLIAGTVLVESIFTWPGLGLTIVDSIREKDYPVAQGVIVVYGLIVLLVTLLVDVVLVLLDPRSALKEN